MTHEVRDYLIGKVVLAAKLFRHAPTDVRGEAGFDAATNLRRAVDELEEYEKKIAEIEKAFTPSSK